MKKVTIPLLKDHHSHPLFYAAMGKAVSLQSVTDKAEANRLIKEAGMNQELTVAHGWRSNQFQWSQSELESFSPVAIFNVSLHSLLLNQTAKEILAQKYGQIISKVDDRDWYESNLRTVLNWFANLNASVETLTRFYDDLLQQGVCYAEELLLVDGDEIDLFEKADLLDRTKFWAAPDTFTELSADHKKKVHGLKLFTDGAIGARTAATNRPFLNNGSHGEGTMPNIGMLIYSDAEFLETLNECLATGLSLAVHAIGDRAIEQVITCIEKSVGLNKRVPEIRMEHAQLIDLNQAKRAKDLGIKLSMQPNFSHDSIDYTDRLDKEYCDSNNPFRMLIDQAGFIAGDDLIFGSDGMPHGVEFAIEQSLSTPNPGQRLTIDEFVAGYCWQDETWGTVELEIEI